MPNDTAEVGTVRYTTEGIPYTWFATVDEIETWQWGCLRAFLEAHMTATIAYIKNCPTTVPAKQDYPTHESILRSYQILEKVKDYLRRGVPADVILELVVEMEASDA